MACRVGIAMLFGVAFLGGLLPTLTAAEDQSMTYQVVKAKPSSEFDGRWDGDFWSGVKPLELKHFMGERPDHFPGVQAKLSYDDSAVYVIFRVEDRYVRAVAQRHQGEVFKDSCVEFFFTPHTDVDQGYFNLEMNCGGTMLLHYQRIARQQAELLADADLAKIEVLHSLPKIVDPEITDDTEWTVAYRIPVSILGKYFAGTVQQPAPGVTWRANLYKCADDTSHPHWLTWSPVEFERPDFHRPQSFGTLVFE